MRPASLAWSGPGDSGPGGSSIPWCPGWSCRRAVWRLQPHGFPLLMSSLVTRLIQTALLPAQQTPQAKRPPAAQTWGHATLVAPGMKYPANHDLVFRTEMEPDLDRRHRRAQPVQGGFVERIDTEPAVVVGRTWE